MWLSGWAASRASEARDANTCCCWPLQALTQFLKENAKKAVSFSKDEEAAQEAEDKVLLKRHSSYGLGVADLNVPSLPGTTRQLLRHQHPARTCGWAPPAAKGLTSEHSERSRAQSAAEREGVDLRFQHTGGRGGGAEAGGGGG